MAQVQRGITVYMGHFWDSKNRLVPLCGVSLVNAVKPSMDKSWVSFTILLHLSFTKPWVRPPWSNQIEPQWGDLNLLYYVRGSLNDNSHHSEENPVKVLRHSPAWLCGSTLLLHRWAQTQPLLPQWLHIIKSLNYVKGKKRYIEKRIKVH